MAEGRMNLAALQQRDPYITEIVDTASQVALYSFNSKSNEWEKTSIEGSLFIYKRSASPLNGFMILNRLGLNNLIEPITKDLEFQQQDPFLLYRNAKSIFGVWFYDKDECGRLGGMLNRYVQAILEEQNRKLGISPAGGATTASERDSVRDSGKMAVQGHQQLQQSQVDIMQMLSKAQQEYDTQGTSMVAGVRKKTEPKPMIDNPNASATSKASNIIRPKPLKMPDTEDKAEDFVETGKPKTPLTAGTISLDALFRTASLQQGGAAPAFPAPDAKPPTILKRSVSMTAGTAKSGEYTEENSAANELPSILKHIMSSGSMVEDIERHHITRDEPVPTIPDLSQPPPNHPAYRGPSPHTQSHGHVQQTRKSPRDMKPSAKDKVVFGLHGDDSYGFNPKPELGPKSVPKLTPGSSASTGILTGALLPSSVSAIPSQHLSVSQSSSVPVPAQTTETVYGGNSSPRGQGDSVTKDKPDVSPPVLKSEALLTPADMLQPSTVLFSSQTEKSSNPNLAAAAASLTTELLSPMAFITSTSRKTPPVSTVPEKQFPEEKVKETDSMPIAALTKEQLQQALLYLIKNDSNFISTIHEAYLKSLKELAGHKS